MDIEPATEDDRLPILGLLERAMASDPFVGWLARPGPRHERARRAYVSLMLERIAIPRGAIWVARDAGAIAGAALWAPPNTFQLGAGETLRILPLMVDVVGLARMGAVSRVLERIDADRPPEPRWLLTVLGVSADHRGRGVGSALVRPALERCDEAGVVAVCETANPKALPFYRRLGFEAVADRVLAEGVTSWTLVREPGAGMVEGSR